jgi:hypothetical protein
VGVPGVTVGVVVFVALFTVFACFLQDVRAMAVNPMPTGKIAPAIAVYEIQNNIASVIRGFADDAGGNLYEEGWY